MIRIVFRVDASIKIGSGHAMRCLALAEALMGKGISVSFISRAHVGNLNEIISKQGVDVIELSAPSKNNSTDSKQDGDNYDEWLGVSQEQDAWETIEALGKDRPYWLVVDHYALCEKWENQIQPYVKNIMVIDDLANRRHHCNMLLDQNWFENMETRYDDLLPAGCTRLLGPKFALLRSEFSEARKILKPRDGNINRVFVFFGGSDPHNLTGMTLLALSEPELMHLKIDVVIGKNNTNLDKIHKIAILNNNINLHIQVNNMAIIMAKTDLVIGAGGVNIWERICLNIPSLVVSFSDNQKLQLNDLINKNMVHYVGNIQNINMGLIKDSIIKLCKNSSIIKEQLTKTKNLVDGFGQSIVSDWLIGDLSSQSWEVKNAANEDMELYWIWANDKQVRNNALKKEIIPLEDHIKWFRNRLANNNCSLYIILVDKKPVGQVRFEKEGDYARIDYSIDRQFRGRRLGNKILRLAIMEYQKNNSIKILGEVLPNNIPSSKIFESLGFNMEIKSGKKIYTKDTDMVVKVND